jgi:hypothetical protein
MTKIEKVYYENGIKITRIPEKKRKNNTVIKSSSQIQHQKGCFGSKAPYTTGVSSIYNSVYDRKPRNTREGRVNTTATEKRAY